MQSISEQEENESESSSEAAGLARGAARTVNTISKQVRRQVVGKLPKQGSPKITVPKPNIAKVRLPKKIKPIKKVATVSDKLSSGLDIYDTYDYAASTVKESDVKEKTAWRTRFKTIIAFTGTFIKNSILGATVFEGYEKTISYFDSRNVHHQEQSSNTDDVDVYARTSVAQHFAAGAVGGTIHSLGVLGFMSFEHLYKHGFDRNRMFSYQTISAFSMLHTIHHSMAHALLFSSYEFVKRKLFDTTVFHDPESLEENHSDYSHLVAIGTAGGVAGVIQYVSSFYTEKWLYVGEENRIDDWKKYRFRHFFAPRPLLRSMAMSFPPSAIGFIAFESGKEFISMYSNDSFLVI